MAMGIPVLLGTATGARSLAARGLAAGVIPLLALCAFLTASRGGAIGICLAVVVFVVLVPDRMPKLPTMGVIAAGCAVLIAAANARPAVRDGFRTPLAGRQGDQLLVICIVAVLAVALAVVLLGALGRRTKRPGWSIIAPRRAWKLTGIGGLAALAVFIGTGGPGFLHRKWDQFKSTGGPATTQQINAIARLQNVNGNGRYQYWQAAVRAADTRLWGGRGAGTYQFWWARDGTLSGGFVRDAHSLYLQSLAELGIPGLVLIAGFVLWALGWGIVRCARSATSERRLCTAAASAAIVAFAWSAAFEWIWFIAVLPAALFVLMGVIFADTGEEQQTARQPFALSAAIRPLAARVGVTVLSLSAIAVILVTTAATSAVRLSQGLYNEGRYAQALARARDAEQLQPYAATPQLQDALILERLGDYRAALGPARRATVNEPTNWRTWATLSRLEARAGDVTAALADFRKARSLDPRSLIFNG
jgi:O-antigen ligase